MEAKYQNRLFNPVYLLFCLINALVSVSFSMVSTTMARYVHGAGMSVAMAGMITGAFSLASMVIRPFSGFINDHMSKKRLLILSTATMAGCTCCYMFTIYPAALITLRVLHGLAFSISSTVNMAVIPEIVPKKRTGEAISYYGVIQSVAMAFGPSIGMGLANAWGFPATFTVSASICAVGALVATALKFDDTVYQTFSLKGFTFHWSDIFARECFLYALIDIAISSANGLENSMISLYGAATGISNIGWYFTLSAAILCLTRIALGKLADQKGTAYAVYPGLALMTAGFLILWRADSEAMFAIASVLKTIGVGLCRPAIQAACLKAVPPSKYGVASSTYYMGSDIGQGTSPSIGGHLVDRSGGNYGLAFGVYTIPLIVSALLYFAASSRKKRRS